MRLAQTIGAGARHGDVAAENHNCTSVWTAGLDRLLKVVALILEDNGGNDLVETKRGKLFTDPVIDLTTMDSDEEDEEEDRGNENDLEGVGLEE